jgi:1,4-alpha-glucan branching enzyme
MSIKKQELKSKPVTKVTFEVEKEIFPSAQMIHVVGEFNNWDKQTHPMKKNKAGKFSLVIDLPTGKEYQFKYLINESEWQNDPEADKYQNTDMGQNSVVVC